MPYPQPRLALASFLLLIASPLLARPIGYRIPTTGGPQFANMDAVYRFASKNEIAKYVTPSIEVSGVTPRNVIPKGPAPIKAKSRLDWITNKTLGALFVLHLPNWCGHLSSADHVVYVLRKSPQGLQLIARTESEGVCRISESRSPALVCDSYHGAKGSSRQEWNGKTFQ